MPLSVRSNGQLISSDWFNQFSAWLTGATVGGVAPVYDQNISTYANIISKSIYDAITASPPTLALAAGTNLGIGLYDYLVYFQNAEGIATATNIAAITTTTGNQKVLLTGIPLGPTGTTSRLIARTTVGATGSFYLLTTINDNTTTTFTDTIADAALTNSTYIGNYGMGGCLAVQDAAGNPVWRILVQGTNQGSIYGPTNGGIACGFGTFGTVTASTSYGPGNLSVQGASTFTGALTINGVATFNANPLVAQLTSKSLSTDFLTFGIGATSNMGLMSQTKNIVMGGTGVSFSSNANLTSTGWQFVGSNASAMLTLGSGRANIAYSTNTPSAGTAVTFGSNEAIITNPGQVTPSRIFIQGTAPASGMNTNDIWIKNAVTYGIYVYISSAWTLVAS